MPGALTAAGDEIVQMAPGEAWWMNNRAEHEVANNSEQDRIVLIADIRPATP
jgi:aspartyl/asparaginyl beta-hydroxylase (cupin superfamily)